MSKKLLLILAFSCSYTLLPGITQKGSGSQILFGSNSQLQANASLSGLSHSVIFPANSNFQLNGNDPNASLGGITSTAITFGQNNIIELTSDASIGQADQTWLFPYNAIIDGKGHTLTILGSQGITVSGSAALTITNAKIVCGARQAIGCTSDTATILLTDSSLILGSDGLFWGQGNLTIDQNVSVVGLETSFFPTPSNSEFSTQLTTLGFAATTQHTNSSLYTMDFSGPSDDRAGISMVALDKTSTAYYSDDNSVATRTWHQIPGGLPFQNISIGVDGTIWLTDVGANVYVYRVHKDSTPNLLTAQNISGTVVSVGNRFNVFVLNSTTGKVYKCSDPDRGFLNNPLTGAPQTWVQIPNVKATSIAAGSDGSLWYVNASGQVILRDCYNNETLVHDGAGHTFVKVSAKGTSAHNSVALTCLVTSRAYISHDNGPFKDIGLSSVVEASTDADGNLMMIFDNSIIPEDPTYGAPIYYRHSFAEKPVLAMDRTLNFSASAGANLTILSGGTLAMGEGTTLRINADNICLESAYDARRHLVLTDNSSTLMLNRANLEAVSAGLTLTSGTVIVEGICGLFPSSWPGCQIEISSDVRLKIHSSSNLQAYGRVDYCSAARLYNPPATINQTTHTLPTYKNMDTALRARGFIKAVGQAMDAPPGVNYNTSQSQTVLFGLNGGVYYIANMAPSSTLPLFSNFRPRGTRVYGGSWDIGDDDTIYYSWFYGPEVSISLNSDSLGNNNGQGSGGIGGQILQQFDSRFGPYPVDITVADAANWGFRFTDGSLIWNSSNGESFLDNTYKIRTFAVAKDGLWYVDGVGEIWYASSSNPTVHVRYKGPRGLDIVQLAVRGYANNYKMMAIDRNCNVYSADPLNGLQFEKIYSNQVYPGYKSISVSTDGFAQVDYYYGYTRGYQPSSWCQGEFFNLYYPPTGTFNPTGHGFAAFPFGISAFSNGIRQIGNQIELILGGGGRYLLNPDFTVASNDVTLGQMVAAGNDGSYVTNYNGGLYLIDQNNNETLILNITGDETQYGQYLVGMHDANNIYIVRSFTGKLQRWAGGTNWTDIYTNTTGIPVSMAASNDGGLWFVSTDHKLWFLSPTGTFSRVKGSIGTDWFKVSANGSSTNYKLLAPRLPDGLLFSGDQSKSLESEDVYGVISTAVFTNGFYLTSNYAGWIKGLAPKSWLLKYPIYQ